MFHNYFTSAICLKQFYIKLILYFLFKISHLFLDQVIFLNFN